MVFRVMGGGAVALVLVALAAGASLGRPGSAGACSFSPTYDPVAESVTVIQGRIVAVSETVPAGVEPASSYRTVTIEVYQRFKGEAVPPRVDVVVGVTDPSAPVPCFRMDFDKLNGRALVAGLNPGAGGVYFAGATSVWFEDERSDQYPGQWKLAQLVRPEVQAPETGIELTYVFIPGNLLDSTSAVGGTVGQEYGSLEVYADGRLCTNWDTQARNPNNDAFAIIGRVDQPSECRTPGAEICVQRASSDASGRQALAQRFIIQTGRNQFVTTLELADPGVRCDRPAVVPRPPTVGTGLANEGTPTAVTGGFALLLGVLLATTRSSRSRPAVANVGAPRDPMP